MKSVILLILAMTAPTAFAQFSIGTTNGCPSSHVGYNSVTKTFKPTCGGQTSILFEDWDLEGCVLEHLDLSQCTSVTSMGSRMPCDNTYPDIQSIIFPPNLVEIPAGAFLQCPLTSVDFGENSQLQTIGDQAFAGTILSSIVIPKSVHTIGMGAFYKLQNQEGEDTCLLYTSDAADE